ncbi:MAG: N-acetyltransferase [Acidimicrobiia bacterium]|nr:MAG: N-acetyltransferase [Acidimicrobiia bacterium]
MTEPIVPHDFPVPRSFDGTGYHLEALGPIHNERDHAAWMGSIEHIRSTLGFPMADGWPYPMSLDDNLSDLEGHLVEFEDRTAFAYSVLDDDEVIGCVYVTPDPDSARGVGLRSWVVETRADLDEVVRDEVTEWLVAAWPFPTVTRIGE